MVVRAGEVDWFFEPDSFRPWPVVRRARCFISSTTIWARPRRYSPRATPWHGRSITTPRARCGMSVLGPWSAAITGSSRLPMIWTKSDLSPPRNFARSGSRGNGRTRRAGSITTGSGIMSRWRGSMRARIRLGCWDG